MSASQAMRTGSRITSATIRTGSRIAAVRQPSPDGAASYFS
jgi:hypothetical protein